MLALMVSVVMTIPAAAVSFTDTQGHWAEATILELAEQGIINGKGEGIYDPQGTVTRAEFMKLLVCALNEYDATFELGEGTISDINNTDWYYGYVANGLRNKVFDMSDIEDTEFLPQNGMSRGDVAVWITNGLGIATEGENTFVDVKGEKIEKAVITAALEGLVTGYEDNTYRPENTLTRAEAAVIIKRVMAKDAEFNTLRQSPNEATYADGLINIKPDGTTNVLKSVDENTKVAVFENCTAAFTGLKAGDVVYIDPTAEYPSGIIFKVGSVSVDGTTVTVNCEQPKLQDIFKSVDIAQSLAVSADDYINGSSSYGITVKKGERMPTENGGEIIAGDGNELILFELSESGRKNLLNVNHEFKEGGLSGNVTIKSDVVADVKLDIGLFKADFSGSVKVETVESANITYAVKDDYEKRWDLGDFSVSIYGPLAVIVDIDLVFTAEGEFEITASAYAQQEFGMRYAGGKATMINEYNSNVNLSANAKGEVRLGPSVDVGLGVDAWIFGNISVIDVEGNLGIGISAETAIEHNLAQSGLDVEYTSNSITPDEDGNLHICDLCVDGEVFVFLNGNAGISKDVTDLVGIDNKKARVDFGENTWTITDWYFSIIQEGIDVDGEFGLGTCPNIYKAIKITKQPADVTTTVGGPIKLDVKAGSGKNGTEKASQQIVYKWYKDGEEIADEFSNTLSFAAATMEDSGVYSCKAYYSALGEKVLYAESEEVTVEVAAYENGPEFVSQPQSITVDEGYGVSMSAMATAPAGALIEYQWYKNGAPVAGATASSFSIASSSNSDEGTYHCVAKIQGFDHLATTSASATLTVTTQAEKNGSAGADGVLDTDIFGGTGGSTEGLGGNKTQNNDVLDTDIFG